MNSRKTIFVQIPSYRDPQLVPTMEDMIDSATSPHLLRIVVCWQHGPEQDVQYFRSQGFELIQTESGSCATIHHLRKHGAAIELLDVHYAHAKGCGWARNLAQQRYRGENYNLQIDSHHRFARAWDVKMKNLLELLRTDSPKPLLTGHPPGFDPDTYPSGRQESTSAIVFDSFSPTGLVSLRSVRLPPPAHGEIAFKGKFVAGGFIFSDGSFIQDVMSDPDQFFCTEEISLSTRAFTYGYDFFHPYAPLLWHQYNNHARKIWDDQPESPAADAHADMSIGDRSDAEFQKTLALMGLPTKSAINDLGTFGLGSQRTLLQYERHCGISFHRRAVQKNSLTPQQPDRSSEALQATEWEQNLIYFRSVRVRVSHTSNPASFPTSVLVTAHSIDEAVQATYTLSGPELEALSR